MPRQRLPNNSAARAGRRRLAAWAGAAAVVWLAALPWASRTAAVRQRIARDEALGVDPCAKFYTELPAMPAIVARVRARTPATGRAAERPVDAPTRHAPTPPGAPRVGACETGRIRRLAAPLGAGSGLLYPTGLDFWREFPGPFFLPSESCTRSFPTADGS